MKRSIIASITSLVFVTSMLASNPVTAGNNRFSATLTGDQVRGAIDTPAIGKARAKFDQGYSRLEISISVRNLVGSINGGQGVYLRCGRPGEIGPAVAKLVNPMTVEGNRIKATVTNDNLLPMLCGADSLAISNVASLAYAMRQGYIYLLVHTSAFANGEIRGQLE